MEFAEEIGERIRFIQQECLDYNDVAEFKSFGIISNCDYYLSHDEEVDRLVNEMISDQCRERPLEKQGFISLIIRKKAG